jgi:hypothetical protein
MAGIGKEEGMKYLTQRAQRTQKGGRKDEERKINRYEREVRGCIKPELCERGGIPLGFLFLLPLLRVFRG